MWVTGGGDDVAELLGELLEGCKRGDECAVRALVGRFTVSAQSLAEAILNDEHLAEDAVQNGFLTALRKLGQLRDPKAFPGWFRQIVRTATHRILRRCREPAAGAMSEAPAGHVGPDGNAQMAELRSIVREAVKKLPPAGHQAAEMFYFEQRSQAEIAEFLHVPEGTVKRRLHDARQQLRDMLLGYIGDEMPSQKPEAPPEWQLPL